MKIKQIVYRAIRSTVSGQAALLMLVNAYRTFRTPVYDTHLLPGQFDQECERLWRHVNKLLPPAGYPVSEGSLDGKSVLVIGVGSTFGFCLLLYAMGAKRVVAVDPFLRATDRELERQFAKHLIETIPWSAARQRAKEYVDECQESTNHLSGLVDGSRIHAFQRFLEDEGTEIDSLAPYDLIVSNAVLEHLRSIDTAMVRFKQLLAPSGGMTHEYGLVNHGLFEEFHPLKFLEFSPTMWRLMTSNGSPPNRVPFDAYKRAASRAGLERVEHQVLTRHSADEAEYAMKHAHPAVRADTVEDMAVLGACLTVKARPENRTNGDG